MQLFVITSLLLTKTNNRGVLKKAALENVLNFTENQLCENVFFSKVALLQHTTFLKKTPAQVIPCDFCLIFTTTIL